MKVTSKIIENFKKDKFLLPVLIFCFVFFILVSILPFFQIKQGFFKFFSPYVNSIYIFTELYQ